MTQAGLRKALGKPPGKGASIGDGVNWEVLLVHAQDGSDLCLVSADGDFASPLDNTRLDDFLADEWARRKHSSVQFYRDIKQFLDDKFPSIRLASDVRKYFLVDALIESLSFAQSHDLVAEPNQYDSFTSDEAVRLLSGALENNQVRWLARDEDVRELLGRVLGPRRGALPQALVDRWDYVIAGYGYAYGSVPTEEDIQRGPAHPSAMDLSCRVATVMCGESRNGPSDCDVRAAQSARREPRRRPGR